jgi:hypothetical protein
VSAVVDLRALAAGLRPGLVTFAPVPPVGVAVPRPWRDGGGHGRGDLSPMLDSVSVKGSIVSGTVRRFLGPLPPLPG